MPGIPDSRARSLYKFGCAPGTDAMGQRRAAAFDKVLFDGFPCSVRRAVVFAPCADRQKGFQVLDPLFLLALVVYCLDKSNNQEQSTNCVTQITDTIDEHSNSLAEVPSNLAP